MGVLPACMDVHHCGEHCGVLCIQVCTGEARNVKLTGIFQGREMLNPSSSWDSGNDVVYSLVILCYLMNQLCQYLPETTFYFPQALSP